MPRYGSSKRKNRKEEDEDDDDNEEEEEGSVNEDDEGTPKKKKSAKKTPAGEVMVDIGAKKKLTFSKYKGIALVGIREYYEDKKTGEEKVSRTFIRRRC